MILGTYDSYLNAVSTVNFAILFPMGIGIILGGLLFLKLTQYLLKNHFSKTYYTIIGFVLGFLFILCPTLKLDITSIISLVILIICFYIGKLFESKSN